MLLLVFVAAVGLLVFLLVRARLQPADLPPVTPPPPPEPLLPPHAMFDGGRRYATERELGITGPDTDGLGEGILMALVDALRALGVTSGNPIEPEDHGFMTVVEMDGEDVVLQIGMGGDQHWMLLVKSPSGRVPGRLMSALATLDDIRNVKWFGI